MQRFNTIRAKQMAGFMVIAFITAFVSLVSYSGMKNMGDKFRVVIESSPLIESCLNMKITVAQDTIVVMKMMAALDTDELDAIWKEHELNLTRFDLYKNAILQGAELKTGTIFPATDTGLRTIVEEAGVFHEQSLRPGFKVAHGQMMKQLSAEPYDYELLDTIDERIIAMGGTLTGQLDQVIATARKVILKAEEGAEKERTRAARLLLAATLGGIAVAFLLGLIISGKVSGPVKKAVQFTQTIAGGDLTTVLEIRQKDEIGAMVVAMNQMVEGLSGIFKDISTGVFTLNETVSNLSMISDKLKMGAKDLSKRSESVATGSKIMNDGISSISSCATQSATNLSVLTAAMEEMDATVNEIAKNTGKARTITRTAVDAAESASLKIHALGSEAEEIGQVTEVISEISAQTNLLALNAAIEAARAGAAGRGFAVVATEIKALAGQTDGAARDIAEKIAGIQQSTRGGVTEIGEISNVIRAVDEIVSAISAAVEEQTVTSSQIAQNIAEAVQSVNETNRTITDSSQASARMAADVTGVNVNVQDVTNSSRQVSDNAIKLTEFAAGLKEMISRFKV